MAEARTLAEVFFRGIAIEKPDRILYKSGGSYRPMSTANFVERVRRAAGVLAARGIRAGDRVGILSYNRPEWAILDYAAVLQGAVTVPIYSTLPGDQVQYILKDCGARLIFVENDEQLRKTGSLPAIVFDRWEEELHRAQPVPLEELRRASESIDPESLATLIYTSGTTGEPKGVMLTHRNIVSNVLASDQVIRFTESDVALSFLPLSHSFERTVDYTLFYRGATIAYAESTDTVADNLIEVRPTILVGVPRVFEKMYARVQENVRAQSPRKQAIFRWAVSIGKLEAALRRLGARPPLGLRARRWWANRLVFRKIHKRIGGRLRLLVSGSAPLSKEVAEFFWALGFTLLEGYGLTETSPVIAVNREGATRLGTVGPPIPGVEVKIAEDGEILCRGPNVMKGYYNRPEETAAVLKDGWLCTGDVGEIDAGGFLKITDRKKELLKTSGGKYIAPQPIENRLKLQPGVANALVIGDRRRFASALIVPMPGATREQIQDAVDNVNDTLAPHETIKKFALVENDFTIDGGELTPTLKVKRRVVEKRYADMIEKMYAERSEPDAG